MGLKWCESYINFCALRLMRKTVCDHPIALHRKSLRAGKRSVNDTEATYLADEYLKSRILRKVCIGIQRSP